MRRTSLWLLLALLLTAAAPAAAEFDQTFQQTYPLSPTGSVTLTNINGSVRVEGWEQPLVAIEAIKTTRGSPSDLYRVKIDVRSDRHSLEVATHYPQGQGVEVTVNYRIRVPYRATLRQLATVNGEVLVRGMDSGGELRTVNGGVQLLESAGRFALRSTNGNVHIELSGWRAASGLDVETVNGAVTVALPPQVDATLDISSLNGEFRSELPVVTSTSRDFHGQLGRGGSPLRIRTVNGAIQLVNARPTI